MALVAGAGRLQTGGGSRLGLIYRVADLAGAGGAVLQLVSSRDGGQPLLAILNCDPHPPLDGFGVLIALVPPRWE